MKEKRTFSFVCPRTLLCIVFFAISLYAYIDRRNHVVALQMRIPEMTKVVKLLDEENTRLRFEVEQFESPTHLMRLASHPTYSHLKYPIGPEVLTMRPPVENPVAPPSPHTTSPWLIAGIGW